MENSEFNQKSQRQWMELAWVMLMEMQATQVLRVGECMIAINLN